jgi:hypothetical protein
MLNGCWVRIRTIFSFGLALGAFGVPVASPQSGPSPTVLIPPIVDDLRLHGEFLIWPHTQVVALPYPLALTASDDIATTGRLANLPLNHNSFSSGQPLIEVYDWIMTYGLPVPGVLSKQREISWSYLRRISERRNNIVFRFLGITDEYPVEPEPSCFVNEYNIRRRNVREATAHLASVQQNTRSTAAELASARYQLEKAEDLLANMPGRAAITIAMQTEAFSADLDRELSWARLSDDYLSNGGTLWRLTAKTQFSFVPSLENLNSQPDMWRNIPAASIPGLNGIFPSFYYTILRINRAWFDPDVFFVFDWSWNRSIPFGTEFRISDGVNCDALDAFPCLAEFAIVVTSQEPRVPEPSRTSPKPIYLIGFLGEPLARRPSESPGGPQDAIGMDQIRRSYRRDDVAERLRNGTF